ncbi:MAG: sigma-70 family RNA polymerase sigma factor [Myxococcales bacterium]|nr:sigma-70 family RNA polymerase sigma factor [Myxococcales bacterium]
MTSLPSETLSSPLLSEFVGALADDAEYDEARLRVAIEVLLAEARRAHPALLDSEAEFLRYVATRLPGFRPAEQEVAAVHTADLLLARGCALGVATAVASFETDLLGLVSAAARKLSMTSAQADELRQQVRMKLLVVRGDGIASKIGNYAGTGALRSWVYATGLRTGLNELRRIGRAPVPAGDEQLLVAMPDKNDDQQLQYMKELYRSAFRDAFKNSIGELEDRLANVLRHYYLDEMTLEDIGSLYRVHKTTVMRWVNKAHAELEVKTKSRMIAHLQLSASEVESVLRLIQSGIQLGLASVLAPGEPKT